MEINLGTELQSPLVRLVVESGRTANQFIEDAMAIYSVELAEVRNMLNSRYDDIAAGRVTPIMRSEVISRLREKSRSRQADAQQIRIPAQLYFRRSDLTGRPLRFILVRGYLHHPGTAKSSGHGCHLAG